MEDRSRFDKPLKQALEDNDTIAIDPGFFQPNPYRDSYFAAIERRLEAETKELYMKTFLEAMNDANKAADRMELARRELVDAYQELLAWSRPGRPVIALQARNDQILAAAARVAVAAFSVARVAGVVDRLS